MGLWSIGGRLKVVLPFSFWVYRFLCLCGWPSSGYGSTLSLLTWHAGFQGGYYGHHMFLYLFIVCLSCSTERSKRGECCIYGLQLSWCIISFRWWSFQTQLEMPAECTCMHTGHTLNAVYKITNVPVLENTTLLASSISTKWRKKNCTEWPRSTTFWKCGRAAKTYVLHRRNLALKTSRWQP